MKFNHIIKAVRTVLVLSVVLQGVVYAEEDRERCIDPKFRSFNPPNHSEVAPGSEFSLHVKNADKTKISAVVKKIPVELTIEDRNLFLVVKGRIPESLKNTYARISISATAEQGCKSKDGWLVKVLSNEPSPEQAESQGEQETAQAVTNGQEAPQ